MIKRLILFVTIGVTMSGCFMAPIALIGPAASGFSTASIIQSTATSGANYLVKKSTGKSITEHALSTISEDILQQTYLPKKIIKNSKYKNKNTKFLLGFAH